MRPERAVAFSAFPAPRRGWDGEQEAAGGIETGGLGPRYRPSRVLGLLVLGIDVGDEGEKHAWLLNCFTTSRGREEGEEGEEGLA